MKIAFLISALDDGGAARIVSNISSYLPNDWDVDIILNTDKSIKFPYRGNIVSLNVPDSKDREAIKYQIKAFIGRMKQLKKLKDANGYDCCVSYMDSANLANILTSTKRCKTIINVVNNMTASAKYNWKYKYIVNPVIKKYYNKADLIVALSEDVKQDLIDNYGLIASKICVSYCSIILKDIEKMVEECKDHVDKTWFDKSKTVVTAGRSAKQKGQWHLIRAFSRVLKSVPDAKLCVFGNGELRDYFEELIKGYNIADSVKLFDFNSELDAYIASSAIFAFPSLYEGFGTALQEALACGVACVSTDYDTGAREQLAPDVHEKVSDKLMAEYGIITPNCSENMPSADVELEKEEIILADAIIELLTDSDLRLNYAKRAKIRSEEYDIKNIVKLLVNDIERCVGRN